jgi:hypothetical protein
MSSTPRLTILSFSNRSSSGSLALRAWDSRSICSSSNASPTAKFDSGSGGGGCGVDGIEQRKA